MSSVVRRRLERTNNSFYATAEAQPNYVCVCQGPLMALKIHKAIEQPTEVAAETLKTSMTAVPDPHLKSKDAKLNRRNKRRRRSLWHTFLNSQSMHVSGAKPFEARIDLPRPAIERAARNKRKLKSLKYHRPENKPCKAKDDGERGQTSVSMRPEPPRDSNPLLRRQLTLFHRDQSRQVSGALEPSLP